MHAAGTIEIVHAHLHGGGTVAAVRCLAALLQVLLTAAVGIRQLQQLRRENHHIGLLRLGLVVGILLCHGKSSLRGRGMKCALRPFSGILPQSGARGKGQRGKLKEEWGKWGIFEGAGVNGERAVGDAGPYGEVTSSAVSGTM